MNYKRLTFYEYIQLLPYTKINICVRIKILLYSHNTILFNLYQYIVDFFIFLHIN